MRRDDTMTPKVFLICLIVIIGFLIWAIITNFSGDRKVDFDSNGFTETYAIESLALIPGDEREYVFDLKCRDSGEYQLGLTLTEKPLGDGGLKQFVNVRVMLGDLLVYEGPLADVLTGETIIKEDPVSFDRETVELKITYMMPESVGNEAMGTSAKFDMTLILSEKGEKINV